MGQNATETMSEIEATRQRLQRDLEILESRLPDRDDLAEQAKAVGGAVAGAGVAVTVLYLLAKRKMEKRSRYRDARLQAEALEKVLRKDDLIATTPGAAARKSNRSGNVVAVIAALAALASAISGWRNRRS